MEAIGSLISIVGMGTLFAGNVTILLMMGILDVAKIVTVSFLYQYWRDIKQLMKVYMTVASCVLVVITSAGAFGYLSGAFQQAIQPNLEVTLKVDSFKKERDGLEAEATKLTAQREKIDQQIAQLPIDQVRGRQRLIASFKPEVERIAARSQVISKRTDELAAEIRKVQQENIEQDVHVGPIVYLSKAFGVTMEEASKWIILTIIAVFDPLAIMLVIAANFLISRRREELTKEKSAEIYVTPVKAPPMIDLDISKIIKPRTELKVPEPVKFHGTDEVETAADELKEQAKQVAKEVLADEPEARTVETLAAAIQEEVEELPPLRSSLEDLEASAEPLIREGYKTTSVKRLLYTR